MESILDPNHIEGRIVGVGLTKGPIFQGPDFRAPEIKPRQTRLEKFAALVASRTPQEKGALIGLFGTFTVALLLSLSQCSRVSTENAILKHDTQNMAGKIREQDTTILKLSTEKASLESRLTTFESVPFQVPSIIKNLENILATEPTNRQAILSLLYSVEALTNSLAEVAMRPTFDLYINQTKITNGTVLDLKQSRTLSPRIKNTSAISIEQLSFDFVTPLELNATNLDAPGWQLSPQVIKIIDGKEIKSGNQWRWHADNIISGSGGTSDNWVEGGYDVNCIRISTNFPYHGIWVTFNIYAARAKSVNYTVMLKF